jgi:hypothetical protein
MKLPSNKALMVNGAAVMIIGAAVVTQVKSLLFSPAIAPCSERYDKAVALGVERGGVLLTAADVQAAAAGADSGVMENLTLMHVKDGPAPNALAVAVRAGSMHPEHAKETRGGISFPWRPRALPPSVPAACLSYDVFLGPNFDFGPGAGTLPGIVGSSPAVGAQDNEKFRINFGWAAKGMPRLRAVLTSEKESPIVQITSGETALSRGRWVRIDQEIILNTPKKSDGVLRLFIDGSLIAEKLDAILRHSADGTIEGVLSDVHFGASRSAVDGRATKDEQILLTPYELRWK